MQPNRHEINVPCGLELEHPSPTDPPKIGISRMPDEAGSLDPELQNMGHSMFSNELERSKRALALAQERIAELMRAQLAMSGTVEQLTELASTDALTGLSNRRPFLEALKTCFQAAMSHNRPMSFLMIDIDAFKSYNDTFGHTAGDEVIWVVAKLLLRNSRNDQIVARYGGEEFAIVLPEADTSLAIEIAERQRAAIESYPWPSRQVTASFGISTFDPTIRDPGTMIEQADRALYHSKDQGRNRVTHHRALVDELPDPAWSTRPRSLSETADASKPPAPRRELPLTNPTTPLPGPNKIVKSPQGTDSSWEALERFIQALQVGGQASDPYGDVLSAIREGTEAEIVFLCQEEGGKSSARWGIMSRARSGIINSRGRSRSSS